MPKPGPRILIRRHGALGDVLLTTPVASRLHASLFSVNPQIEVETVFVQAFDGNPHISKITNLQCNDRGYDCVVDLNLAYERRPAMHIIDAFFMVAFGDTKVGNKRICYGINPPPPEHLIKQSKIITLHASRSWPSRSLPDAFWDKVAIGLRSAGLNVQFIGAGGDYGGPNTDGIVNLVGKTALREAAEMIGASMCLVCSDSAMMHLAGATDTPIVPLFTSTKPEFRMPYRHNELGWKCYPFVADIDCQGCLHDALPPVTYLTCRRGDNACIESIPADSVVSKVVEVCQLQN